MPVGNDVVDLHDPDNQPDAIHPRFDRRVFSDSEIELIEAISTVPDRHILRWTLWAAKESVFKLVQQGDESIPFRPRSFVTRLPATDRAEVTFDGSVYPVVLDITEQRIHAVARTSETVPASGIDQPARQPNSADASMLVRAQAARVIGERLGIEPEDIEFTGKIPRATHDGKRLPVDVSLSHHGRFLAHAVLWAAVFLAVPLAGCSSPTEPDTVTAVARAVWQAQGIDSYRFDYERFCFCAFIGPVRITVEDGAVVAVESLVIDPPTMPDVATFPTFDNLFDELAAAEASDPVRFDVVFDPSKGYPVSASVDISFQIADEEFSFGITSFEAIEPVPSG